MLAKKDNFKCKMQSLSLLHIRSNREEVITAVLRQGSGSKEVLDPATSSLIAVLKSMAIFSLSRCECTYWCFLFSLASFLLKLLSVKCKCTSHLAYKKNNAHSTNTNKHSKIWKYGIYLMTIPSHPIPYVLVRANVSLKWLTKK